MSMLSMNKTCPQCNKKYSFNPDTGKGLVCPYCCGTGITKKDISKKKIDQAPDKRK